MSALMATAENVRKSDIFSFTRAGFVPLTAPSESHDTSVHSRLYGVCAVGWRRLSSHMVVSVFLDVGEEHHQLRDLEICIFFIILRRVRYSPRRVIAMACGRGF